jgi:hypothetical protein
MIKRRRSFVVKRSRSERFDSPVPQVSADLEKSRIRVDLDGQRLVVTMSETAYRTVFYKHLEEPRLVEANSVAVDREARMCHTDFEDLAWKTANAKARKLGWIS